jgi:hypothetical protein
MKKTNITLSIALAAVFSASTAFAEAEVTGKIIHESGFFSNAGSVIGADGVGAHVNLGAATQTVTHGATPVHSKNDAMKRETTARIYIDGEADEIADGATYHVELNIMTDGKANSNYDSHESYTQRDALREAYVDAEVGDWSVRTGKQQVVWGTADGMKLLDMINPSDYGEMAQNQMEDSRIPVWMINAETTNADGSEFQVIASQPRENVFAGLNRHTDTSIRKNNFDGAINEDVTLNNGTDTGHAFMMKGPDTITGVHNGFLNIAPDLGGVAARFAGGFGGVGTLATAGMNGFVLGGIGAGHFEPMTMKVMAFSMNTANAGEAVAALLDDETEGGDYTDLPGDAGTLFEGAITGAANFFAGGVASDLQKNNLTGQQLLKAGFASQYDTNLADLTTEATAADSTAFDYMGNTTFMTFDAFVNAGSQYVYDMPTNSEIDLATRYKNSTADGINYTLNASYNYDKNPIIDLSWRNAAGAKLAVNKMVYSAGTMIVDSSATSGYTLMLTDAVKADGTVLANGEYGGAAGTHATLRFTQKVKRVKNIGGSFDMAIETKALGPIVIRGEALYTKDSHSPIIDKTKLSYGDLVGALEMVKGDRFKLVLGADITVLTNMMVSAQFIQDSDLDFVDGANRYTADYATMHMTNGFNKAIEDKNFYSLFFSKPFGASGEHRWNNITMYEENGGKWNRLDAEFSIDDDTQATVEYNKYWGNENTQFGQLAASSNIQVGVKYSF